MAADTQVRRIPNAIRRFRTERALAQVQLAQKVGVSPQDMNHIEHGRRLPTRDQARRIARVLGCKPEDLWSGTWLQAVLSE